MGETAKRDSKSIEKGKKIIKKIVESEKMGEDEAKDRIAEIMELAHIEPAKIYAFSKTGMMLSMIKPDVNTNYFPLTSEEVGRMLLNANIKFRAMIAVLCETGELLSTVLNLKYSDIEFGKGSAIMKVPTSCELPDPLKWRDSVVKYKETWVI